ncbi:hypothetical protein QRX60_39020 [Amycolatopsis mongoliensis]|uniref:Shikimate kinase n=1 Tax=Amycolatopsis mongoliensis TaxID=715475 RepID=A0A9Y2NJC9_9PSEU|nr:hypothetical protein [Amycolatopsis sp. 4-36]WIX99999.1 hypothetical protein QRX60_39020 [Amycolatopsis sp. 4-36]
MPLVWVTGNAGVGRSAVCALLKSRGELAVDADRFGWQTSRAEVEALAARAHGELAFFCGSTENDEDLRDLFDLVVCLVVDDDTLRDRLLTRTSNSFGKHPEELAAALEANEGAESACRRLGATIVVDGRLPLPDVADAILAAAGRLVP